MAAILQNPERMLLSLLLGWGLATLLNIDNGLLDLVVYQFLLTTGADDNIVLIW